MLEELKKAVFEANLDLVAKGLTIYTWGNVGGIDNKSCIGNNCSNGNRHLRFEFGCPSTSLCVRQTFFRKHGPNAYYGQIEK